MALTTWIGWVRIPVGSRAIGNRPTSIVSLVMLTGFCPWDNAVNLCESFQSQGHPNMVTANQERFFFEHYGLTNHDLETYLGAALSAGGDYADLYFEYLTSTSLMVDESLV